MYLVEYNDTPTKQLWYGLQDRRTRIFIEIYIVARYSLKTFKLRCQNEINRSRRNKARAAWF